MKPYGIDPRLAEAEIQNDAQKIKKNPLLHEIYLDVYARIVAELPPGANQILEIGSGGGFLKDSIPGLITSELEPVQGIDRVLDACQLDAYFAEASLDCITGFNVFHHLPDPTGFLRGSQTTLRPGGRVVLVEPWFTPLGQWFYRLLHHEPWIADPDSWTIANEGRLGGANSKLPTNVFGLRRERLDREFPLLRLTRAQPFHKWLYLFSGGLRLNTRIPRLISRWLVQADRKINAGDQWAGLFALIVLERLGDKQRSLAP
ncbi:MAG TPA: methyltransferase domain-containing protein [Thermoanaerobaculia bacterium]|nr:methyltransferase domain-containing protein [Thermoanaerobaculia bacterium]